VTKEQLIIEATKCMKNTPYAMRTYLQTFDNTVKRYVPLDLFPDQITLVEDYDNHNENIALKYRQAGVSTVTAAWASKRLVFAKKNNPEKVLIIANKLDTAVEFANKVRSFTEQWPQWVGAGFSPDKNAARHFKLINGCEVKAVATSKDALRGYTPTILIFDEAAYIEADDDFWAACMASLSTGGKVIVISTPNGYDPIYYEIYDQALSFGLKIQDTTKIYR
jgi:phage FluMu gp28-like protein